MRPASTSLRRRPKDRWGNIIPALTWLRDYPYSYLAEDVTAGVITAVLLVPQGLAYAILAGLPPQTGLYASILPLLIYAVFGTSRTLSVGPVSVAALLVAGALGAAGVPPESAESVLAAGAMAAVSGIMLMAMALLRMGVLTDFLSHPVLSGFTSGAAVLIIISQLGNLTGLQLAADSLAEFVDQITKLGVTWTLHPLTLGLSTASLLALLLMKGPLGRLLARMGLSSGSATAITRAGPLALVACTTMLVAGAGLDQQGVAVVGPIPAGLPPFTLPLPEMTLILDLLPATLLIGLIGYVESVSVARVLAHRRRQKIDTNRELTALGLANLGASVTAGMPVAGGFSRSMVNFDSGARTQLAAMISALLVALAAMFLTPLFHYVPDATLGAIIVVAVWPLMDWRGAFRTWRYSRSEGLALLTAFAGVLLLDIERGLLLGFAVSIAAFVWRSSRPHAAIVGRVPGTAHYRNVQRHAVETWPELLLLRVDRSLYFANVRRVEQILESAAADYPSVRHLVLICSAVNTIDHSALESLEQLADSFRDAGVTLHLAEVKGPVMDRLKGHAFLQHLVPGKIFLSTEQAVEALTGGSGSAPASMSTDDKGFKR